MNKKEELLKLRNGTFAPYDKCLEALEKNAYDFDKAVAWLKENKIIDSAKLNGYTDEPTKIIFENNVLKEIFTKNNEIRRQETINYTNPFVYFSLQDKICVIAEFQKTDGQNIDPNVSYDAFKPILVNIAVNKPKYKDVDSIDDTIKEDMLKSIKDELKAQNKPENLIEKIANAKLNKELEAICLLNQPLILDKTKKVSDILKQENAKIISFIRWEKGEGQEIK